MTMWALNKISEKEWKDRGNDKVQREEKGKEKREKGENDTYSNKLFFFFIEKI